MYQLTVKNQTTEQQTTLFVPLNDQELELQLKEIGVNDIDDLISFTEFLKENNYVPWLPASLLDDANIFQINFLAQRIDSLSKADQENMNAVIEAYEITDVKDLINLTYEIENETYRILEGIENHGELGVWYVTEYASDIPETILDFIDYQSLGSDLDAYEYDGKFCEMGYIFMDPTNQKIYDGKHFPDFAYDRNYIANLEIINNDSGLISYLKLPAGDFAMQRTLKELETGNFSHSHINTSESYILDQYDYLHEKEDIVKLNNLCKELASLNIKDFIKLKAIVEYAEVSNEEIFYRLDAKDDTAYEKLNALYRHLEDFDFFLNIKSPEQYADHLVNQVKMFEIGEELTLYINYRELGLDWVEGEGGKFVSSGYVIDETLPSELEKTQPKEMEISTEDDLEI